MGHNSILVTGCAGFIGFHVAKRLLADGYPVVGVDNLNDYYDVNLKKARLEQLQKFAEFSFTRASLEDRDEIGKFFPFTSLWLFTSLLRLGCATA